MVIFMFELKCFLQLQLKGSHTKTQKNTIWGENVLLNFFTKHTFSLFGLINAHFRPKTSNQTSTLLHFVVNKVLVWLKLISSTFLAFNFGIVTVNPPEVWPVFTLPTRGIKLITLPPLYFNPLPSRCPPDPQTLV